MTYQEVLQQARTCSGPYCKVCPVCNGRACKNTMPGPGSKGSGTVAARNYDAWQEICLNMDTICANGPVDTSFSLFGQRYELPVFAGPVGAVKLHYGDKFTDQEYNAILVSACAKAGIAAFTGDGTDPGVFTAASKAIGENGGKGIYLVTDSTPSMMIHFTNEYLARNQITSEDFRIFANQERATRDVHIYNHRVLKQDDVCENGYINVTDGVLKPLACMAEQLRTNGKTRIYSHMIDRWSAPYYSPTITRAYQGIMASKGIEWKDSIYVKRYISERSFEGKALGNDPDGEAVRDSAGETVALKFDPAWNGYYAENSTAEKNMSTMFVALDDAMWEYFSPNGSGWQLIRTYSLPDEKKEPAEYQRALADLNNTIAAKDYDKLFRYIDQIPRSALSALLNVGMFSEFTASVPSKMTKLRDDASEQLFYEDDIDHVVGSLMASNGIIYLTDKV